MHVENPSHSEPQFRTFIEYSVDAIVLLTHEGLITYANSSIERITGYSIEEFTDSNFYNFVHCDDWERIQPAWIGLLNHPQDFITFELRLRHKDHTWRWMEGSVSNRLSDPLINALICTYRDITERKQAEERLRQSEERYRILVEQATNGIFLTDIEGYFIDSNSAFCSLTGYTCKELLGKNIVDLVRTEDREGLFLGRDVLLTGKSLRSKWHLKRKDGSYITTELSAKQLSNNYLQGMVHDISDRITIEEERTRLLKSEQAALAAAEAARAHLYDLFMQAPANICILRGPEHRFEMANPPYLQTVHLSEEEVIGKTANEAIPLIAQQGYGAILDKVYKTGQRFIGVEMPVRLAHRRDGNQGEAYFNFIYQPFRNNCEEIEGILVHGIEVTHEVLARRRIEELVKQLQVEKDALQEAEQQAAQHASHLAAIFNAMTDAVMVCDTHGHLLQCNAAFYALVGKENTDPSALSAARQKHNRFIPHDLEGRPLPREQWPLSRALQGEVLSNSTTVDLLHRKDDGTLKYFNVSAAPMRNASGEITGAVLVLHDVTERHQLQEQLQYTERKYLSLVNSNIVGVQVADNTGKIYEANECLAQMFGYTMEELLSGDVSWYQLVAPDYRPEDDPIRASLDDKGVILPTEKEHVRKDGSRFPTLMAGTEFDREQKRVMMMFLDITESKELERRKQEFLSMVSHELRTPLTVIMGFLELAQIYVQDIMAEPSPEPARLLKKIEDAVARAEQQVNIELRMVDALLDVSRMEMHIFALSLTNCNLITIMQDTVAYQQQVAHGHRINLELSPLQNVMVRVDKDRIEQVLANYLVNAIKYSTPQGDITVGLSITATTARVFVRDQGPGLTREQQLYIWERFYQTNPALNRGGKNGLGLGLYIAKIIIQQHGGEVGVESTPEHGSTFWFTLPLVAEREQAPAVNSHPQ